MAKGQLWETRPLEFWDFAKELRAGWQKSIESKEKVVGQGNCGGDTGFDWSQAFPALTVIEDNPVGAMMQNKNEPYARRARLASEVRGWGREICGYQGNCWGGQFLGYIEDGSPWPRRKLVVPMPCVCDQHAKRGQQARDFENMPQWMSDRFLYFGTDDVAREKAMMEHKVYCNYRMVNDIERIFGQKFDDDRVSELMNANKARSECSKEISRIMARTIPTPLSVKDLYSVYTIGGLTKIDPEDTVKFWTMVRDEVQWRADNHIAAVGNERFRWIEAHPPSWHYMKYYRYMEDYGAVCLGSQYAHGVGSNYDMQPDGTFAFRTEPAYPADTPIETREDIFRFGATPRVRPNGSMKVDEYIYRNRIVDFAKFMQADGALLPIWRHGIGCTLTRKEQAMYLRDAGLSVIHYEGSQPGDRTDLDERRLLDQLDTWMQSLGFRKFEK
ncbi:MAG: 2-hydroxyacyl-CoA dehydratase [Peptococcaceae bacterium]|jgi:benzoyl-CoA reductase subunit B|nr:2-hydroxyacyl-CoA dehydratase [Peptococcaceae bacterium]